MREKTRVLTVLAALAGGLVAAGTVVVAPPASAVTTASSTVLTSSVNPSSVGQPVMLTATVTGDVPTGTVTFADSGATLGSAALTGGIATLTVGSWAAGTHALTATYDGDANNVGSAGAVTQTVLGPTPPPAPPAAPAPVVKMPRVHLSISTTDAQVGDKVKLTWRTKHADTVTATGDWGGVLPARGSKWLRVNERGKHVFMVTVANAKAKKTDRVVVDVIRKAKELELVVTDELVLVGTKVEVRADGLAAGERYTVKLAGKPVLTGKADKKGDVARDFVLAKTVAEGALDLTITGSNPGRAGAAVLNVIKPKTLDVEVAGDTVLRKQQQTVVVEGLAAGEEVTVVYGGEKITVGKADDEGAFTFEFNVGDKLGERTVKVFGSVQTRVGEATFKVTKKNQGGGGTGGGGNL